MTTRRRCGKAHSAAAEQYVGRGVKDRGLTFITGGSKWVEMTIFIDPALPASACSPRNGNSSGASRAASPRASSALSHRRPGRGRQNRRHARFECVGRWRRSVQWGRRIRRYLQLSKRSAELRVRISSSKQKGSIVSYSAKALLEFCSQHHSEDEHCRQTAHGRQSELCGQFSKAAVSF